MIISKYDNNILVRENKFVSKKIIGEVIYVFKIVNRSLRPMNAYYWDYDSDMYYEYDEKLNGFNAYSRFVKHTFNWEKAERNAISFLTGEEL